MSGWCGGVWMVYGWYLGVAWTFWIMSSVYWCQINWEKSTRYRFNEVSQFLPVVHFRLKQAHRPKFSTGGGRIFFGVYGQFFGSDGQVMDVGTQWGWWRRKILTGPIYPPTLFIGVERNRKQRNPVKSITSWIASGTHLCIHSSGPFIAFTFSPVFSSSFIRKKNFLWEYLALSEIYVQRTRMKYRSYQNFLSACNNWKQETEIA